MIQFDSSPTIYWFLGYLLAGVLLISAFFDRIPALLFLLASAAVLLFKRLPAVVFNRELNADESQMLSHALTLYRDPVYWRSVDGTTIGPLDSFVLVIPRLLGYQIDYTSGRAVGLVCTGLALLFFYLSVKNWYGDPTARVALLLPLLFLSFTQNFDFVHYSSEQLPVFLLAAVLWLFSKLSMETHTKRITTYGYLVGFIAGMIPFAKLQGAPQAVVLCLCAFWICFQTFRKTGNFLPVLSLIAGGITFPALTLVWLSSQHLVTDMIDFYLQSNLIYAGESIGPIAMLNRFFKIAASSPDFLIFSAILFIPVIIGAVKLINGFIKPGPKENQAVSVLIFGLILASIYAVTKSGHDFIHYLNFSIIPLSILAACGVSRVGRLGIVFPVLLLGWFVSNDAFSYVKHRKLNEFISENATKLGESPVVKALKKYTKPDDYMVVWGWQCTYYVEAQLSHGTAENHSERSIFLHALRDKYRNRYLSDIKRSKPAVFLDAVGKNSLWLQDKKTQSLASFPALSQYISQHYTFKGVFEDTRLYVRNDRL